MKRARFLQLAVLAGASLALIGCDSIREAAGVTKQPPDEFAVVTKAPLIIPPDYNLRPPKPGAPPLNQVSPTQTARSALLNTDPASVAASIQGTYSPGERMLLATAGAAESSNAIRQLIAADNAKLQAADPSFTDRLLFGDEKKDSSAPIDADAEAKRIVQSKEAGSVPGGTEAERKANDSATIQKGESDDDGGWFSNIF
ncbi:MAG: DUF3035 domain-containing protein [Alphaproteobacteria bacterium]|nr:DUF3035 domain-containing protein [Alphaproteobacteria bacterium]